MADYVTRFLADTRGIRRGSREAEQAVARFTRAARRDFQVADRAGQSLATNLTRNFRSGALGLLGFEAARRTAAALVDAADQVTLISNRLQAARSTATLDDVIGLSNQTLTSIQASGVLVSRIALSTQNLNISQERQLAIARAIQQTYALSGATIRESVNSTIQFTQGLASNRLAGDELRGVLEGNARLSNALAEGLGVSIGGLRELAEQGGLTTDRVLGAIESQAAGINDDFQELTRTFGQAFQVAVNGAQALAGEMGNLAGDALGVREELIRTGEELSDIARYVRVIRDLWNEFGGDRNLVETGRAVVGAGEDRLRALIGRELNERFGEGARRGVTLPDPAADLAAAREAARVALRAGTAGGPDTLRQARAVATAERIISEGSLNLNRAMAQAIAGTEDYATIIRGLSDKELRQFQNVLQPLTVAQRTRETAETEEERQAESERRLRQLAAQGTAEAIENENEARERTRRLARLSEDGFAAALDAENARVERNRRLRDLARRGTTVAFESEDEDRQRARRLRELADRGTTIALDDETEARERAVRAVDRLIASYDPQYAAQLRLIRAETALAEARRVGGLTAEQEAAAEAAVDQAREAADPGLFTGFGNELLGNVKSVLLRAASNENFDDFGRVVLNAIAVSLLNRSLDRLFENVDFGAILGALGGAFGFGGGRQQGGPVRPGQFYTVGEGGPEVLVPSVPGTVIPQTALGGGGPFVFAPNLVGQLDRETADAFYRQAQQFSYVVEEQLRTRGVLPR